MECGRAPTALTSSSVSGGRPGSRRTCYRAVSSKIYSLRHRGVDAMASARGLLTNQSVSSACMVGRQALSQPSCAHMRYMLHPGGASPARWLEWRRQRPSRGWGVSKRAEACSCGSRSVRRSRRGSLRSAASIGSRRGWCCWRCSCLCSCQRRTGAATDTGELELQSALLPWGQRS